MADSLAIYSDRPLIVRGLKALLPRPWRDRAAAFATLAAFEEGLAALEPGSAIIDGGSASVLEAAARAQRRDVPILLLLDYGGEPIDRQVLCDAAAVLRQEDVDADTLGLALSAAARSLKLLPRGLLQLLAPTCQVAAVRTVNESDRALEALALVAHGYRDAEIGLELNLSESAARKLVQRAVHRLDARTRCEAVAKAIASGELD